MRFGRSLFLFSFSLLVVRVLPQSTTESAQPVERVWFIVSGTPPGDQNQMYLESLFAVQGRHFRNLPEDCSDFNVQDGESKRFVDEYLYPGKTYRVMFGGAAVGTISVNEPTSGYRQGNATYHGNAPLRGEISGLAVSTAVKAKPRASRRPPTKDQEASAKDMARDLFHLAGIVSPLLDKMQTTNLTLTTLLPSKKPKLLGSFKIEGEDGQAHGLFFIASVTGRSLTPEYKWLHIAKSEADSQTMRFVDQADLLGDGNEEVIAETMYYENWSYTVLRHSQFENTWTTVFKSDVLGCE